MLFSMLIIRMIVATFGSDFNGLLSLVNQSISYVKIFELGILNASVVIMFKNISNNDANEINKTISNIQKNYNKIALYFITFSTVVAIFISIYFRNEIRIGVTFLTFILISLIHFIDYLFINKYKIMLISDHKLYIIHWLLILEYIIKFLLIYFIVVQSLDFVFIPMAYFLSHLVVFFITLIYSKKLYKFFKVNNSIKLERIENQNFVIIHEITHLVVNNTDIIVLAIFTKSLGLLSIYGIYSLIEFSITKLIDFFPSSYYSNFGRLYALNKISTIKILFERLIKSYYFIVFTSYTLLTYFFLPFIDIYIVDSDINYKNVYLMLLFVIMGISRSLRVPMSTIISAAGLYKETMNHAIFEMLINILISLALVNFIGIYGLILGTIISHNYRNYTMYKYFNNNFFVTKNNLPYVIFNLLIFVSFIVFNIIYIIRPCYFCWF
jgi:O-antigen/teichoic acid export membrane protein